MNKKLISACAAAMLLLAGCGNTISQNEIGRLSDLAQYFNSYLWEACFSYNEEDGKTKEEKDEYLWLVYECILKLSVLNELEIDRAKHEIDVDIRELRRRISDTKFNSERIIKFYCGEGDTEDDMYLDILLDDEGWRDPEGNWWTSEEEYNLVNGITQTPSSKTR